MAFVLSNVIANNEALECNVLFSDKEVICRIFIGNDAETGAIYSVFVALNVSLTSPESENVWELVFDIVVASPDGQDDYLNDGLQTKAFLVGDHRKAALQCLCVASKVVVAEAMPDKVVMMTVEMDLPKKALSKYGHICKALRDAGYRGGAVDPYHGSHQWILVKRPTN